MREKKTLLVIGMLLFATVSSVAATINNFNNIIPPASSDSEASWPMFHHDIQHTGYSQSTAPYTNKLRWSFQADDMVLCSPIIAEGNVYCASYSGTIYCIGADNGTQRWSYQTGQAVESVPVFHDGVIYVGSADQYLYCLDAYGHGATTEMYWRFQTGGRVEGSPTYYNDKIYFGSMDGKVYCVDLNGNEVWNYTSLGTIRTSPAIAYDCVYIASYTSYPQDKGWILCLNAETGAEKWNYTTGHWMTSSPAVVDDRVYIGSYDYNIYCMDATPEDGIDEGLPDPPNAPYDRIWVRPTLGWVVSSPAVVNNKVYVGVLDEWGEPPNPWGIVYCLNASDGSIIWSFFQSDGWFVSAPAVADGKVFFGSDWTPGVFYCVDEDTGREIWNYTTGSWVYASPAVANGKVYIGSSNGKIYCFDDGGITPQIQMSSLTGGVHPSVSIQNTGTAPAHNLIMNISIDGGILDGIHHYIQQNITTVDVGGTSVLTLPTPVFGFGRVTITVDIDTPGLPHLQQTANGFVFFVYVFVRGT